MQEQENDMAITLAFKIQWVARISNFAHIWFVLCVDCLMWNLWFHYGRTILSCFILHFWPFINVFLLHLSENMFRFELLGKSKCVHWWSPPCETLVCSDLDTGQLLTQIVADRELAVAGLMEKLLMLSLKCFISDWTEDIEASGFLTCLPSNLALCL